jgi:hypothetical protein
VWTIVEHSTQQLSLMMQAAAAGMARALVLLLLVNPAFLAGGCSHCPSRSDVPSRGFDGELGDPVEHLTTQQAMSDFNATRMDWVYTTNASFVAAVHARGISAVTLAMNANLPDHGSSFSGSHTVGRTKNVLEQSLSAPWLPPGQFRPDSPNYGCVNAPEYRSIAFAYADSLLAAGGDAIQHDDPAMNGEVVSWSNGNLTASGCYCDHCMAKFTDTLLATLNSTQRAKYGVRDRSWSYRQWLLARPLPQPHETPDSSALRKTFVDFQKGSVEDYVHLLRDHLHEGTKAKGEPNVTISANNGGHWTSPYQLFDYGMGAYILLTVMEQLPDTVFRRRTGIRGCVSKQSLPPLRVRRATWQAAGADYAEELQCELLVLSSRHAHDSGSDCHGVLAGRKHVHPLGQLPPRASGRVHTQDRALLRGTGGLRRSI